MRRLWLHCSACGGERQAAKRASERWRRGEQHLCHAVCLRPHDVVASLAEGEHSLLLLAADLVPFHFVFFVHGWDLGFGVWGLGFSVWGFGWGVRGNAASTDEQAIGWKDNEAICYVKVRERARSTECNAEEMMYGDG